MKSSCLQKKWFLRSWGQRSSRGALLCVLLLLGARPASAAGYYNLGAFWQAPSNLWVWVSGATTSNQLEVFGTQGVASTANTPSSREPQDQLNAVTWTDASGNLWLFGGSGSALTFGNNTDFLGEFWEFTPSNTSWTWIGGQTVYNTGPTFGTKGAGNTANFPGSRTASFSWVDASSNYWLFGGIAGLGKTRFRSFFLGRSREI